MRGSISCITFVLCCIWVVSCGGSTDYSGLNTIGTQRVDSYALYIEEVILPDVIYAGVDAEVSMRVSADANPTILNGLTDDRWISGVYALGWIPGEAWQFDAFITGSGDPTKEPGDSISMLVPPMPVGEWVLVFRGVAERSLGGTSYRYEVVGSPGPCGSLDGLSETKITVNVVERPEE